MQYIQLVYLFIASLTVTIDRFQSFFTLFNQYFPIDYIDRVLTSTELFIKLIASIANS